MVRIVTSSLTRTGENGLLSIIICLREGQEFQELNISKWVDAEKQVTSVSLETDTKSGTGCDDNQKDLQQGCYKHLLTLICLDDGDNYRTALSVSEITVVGISASLSRSTGPTLILIPLYYITIYTIIYYTIQRYMIYYMYIG